MALTRLVSDVDMANLANGLNTICASAAELSSPERGHIFSEVNRIRREITGWARLHVYDDAGNEMPWQEANFIAECSTHGLFAVDGAGKVGPEDCPVCMRERDGEFTDERQREADRRYDESVQESSPTVQALDYAIKIMDGILERARKGAAGCEEKEETR